MVRASRETPLNDSSDWSHLDTAAYRVSMKRSVRRQGAFLAVIGVVVTACGIAAPLVPLLTIGLVLLAAGLWNVSRPSVDGLLVDGAAVLLTGVFQCLLGFWLEDVRASAQGKWFFTGLLQIVWGIRRIAGWNTARQAVNDPGAIARLEAIIQDLSKRSASDPHVVEFETGRLRRRRNRLGLYAEGAVGLLMGEAVRLERRGDIWIEASGTTALGRTMKVKVRMSDLELDARMAVEHFERFERWKLGQIQAPPAAA